MLGLHDFGPLQIKNTVIKRHCLRTEYTKYRQLLTERERDLAMTGYCVMPMICS